MTTAARALAAALAFVALREVAAQPPALRGVLVSATVQPETLTVGQPFTVRVRVRAPKIATIRFPPVPDSGDAIEAVDPRYVQDAGDNAVLDRTAVYGLVAWDVGTRRPHLANVVVSVSGIDQQFPVSVGTVLVQSLLPGDSASRVPKDAREPVALPSGLWRYLLLAGLAALAAGWYLWRRIRRRARVVPPEPEAFDVASEAFRALESLALVEAGEPGRHVIAHVDVMRAYVARRFPLAAASLTGTELIAALESSELPIRPERVGALLERDAALRYAYERIAPGDADALAREARAIVHDVQKAYEERLRANDKRPARQRRRKTA